MDGYLRLFRQNVNGSNIADDATTPVPVTGALNASVPVQEPIGSAGRVALDFVTITTSSDGRLLTKTIYLNEDSSPALKPFDGATFYNYRTESVSQLTDLARVLDALEPSSCIVNGKLIDGVDPNHARRRHVTINKPTIEETGHFWL